jgi:hypothetical protein
VLDKRRNLGGEEGGNTGKDDDVTDLEEGEEGGGESGQVWGRLDGGGCWSAKGERLQI